MENTDMDSLPRSIAVRSRDPWEKGVLIVQLVLAVVCMLTVILLTMVSDFSFDTRDATEFSMELAGYEGLNATLGNTVSSAFSLKVHAKNRRVVQPWCYDGGEVVVSYSNVALAWGHVPRFCMKRGVPTELNVLAWARGVGLPEDLHRRLDSECYMGTAQVMVAMKLFYEEKGSSYPESDVPLLHLFKLMLRGAGRLTN
ncbi:hypothetical protein EJB05_55600, partial [Eragrostis curvula]